MPLRMSSVRCSRTAFRSTLLAPILMSSRTVAKRSSAPAASRRLDNSAAGVRAPRGKRAAEDFGYVSEGKLALPLRAVPERVEKFGEPLIQDRGR